MLKQMLENIKLSYCVFFLDISWTILFFSRLAFYCSLYSIWTQDQALLVTTISEFCYTILHDKLLICWISAYCWDQALSPQWASTLKYRNRTMLGWNKLQLVDFLVNHVSFLKLPFLVSDLLSLSDQKFESW